MDKFDGIAEGQLSIDDILAPAERLIAVSRIFASARKDMTLNEQKTFVMALSELRFTEDAKSEYVKLDKKVLAEILGIKSDTDHLSQDLYNEVKLLPKHSWIEIADKDKDFYSSGCVITTIAKFRNVIRLKFNRDYLGLFTGLSNNYITMWSSDIFKMTNRRSVQFYEYLRSITDNRKEINDTGLGIKALKEMFEIPKDGKGSYMRNKGGFDRTQFERRVIDPICEDLAKTKMIQLVLQPDGKYYEKVKQGNRVLGYRFYWTFTDRPGIMSASEHQEVNRAIEKNPQVLKVAKDIIDGQKKPKKNNSKEAFGNYDSEKVDYDALLRRNNT